MLRTQAVRQYSEHEGSCEADSWQGWRVLSLAKVPAPQQLDDADRKERARPTHGGGRTSGPIVGARRCHVKGDLAQFACHTYGELWTPVSCFS